MESRIDAKFTACHIPFTRVNSWSITEDRKHVCYASARDGKGPLIVTGGPLDGEAFSALADVLNALEETERTLP
jgi:hypothetical protein